MQCLAVTDDHCSAADLIPTAQDGSGSIGCLLTPHYTLPLTVQDGSESIGGLLTSDYAPPLTFQDGSGSIGFRELNRLLRRDVKSEETKKEEKVQARIEIADIDQLRMQAIQH